MGNGAMERKPWPADVAAHNGRIKKMTTEEFEGWVETLIASFRALDAQQEIPWIKETLQRTLAMASELRAALAARDEARERWRKEELLWLAEKKRAEAAETALTAARAEIAELYAALKAHEMGEPNG